MIDQGLALARTMGLASTLVFALAVPAAAQFPDPPGQSQTGTSSPWPEPSGQSGSPSASPFPDPSGQPSSQSPWPDSSGPSSRPTSASPFPPVGGGQPRSSAPTGPSPFPTPGASAGGPSSSVCNSFVSLRQRAEQGAKAIQSASSRKAGREEVCPLFRRFATAEAEMVNFLEKNQKQCGVPPQAVKEARSQHAQTIKIRNQVCAAPPKPPGPSLSDAFGGGGGAPLAAPTENPRGYGIFDTLTGHALDR